MIVCQCVCVGNDLLHLNFALNLLVDDSHRLRLTEVQPAGALYATAKPPPPLERKDTSIPRKLQCQCSLLKTPVPQASSTLRRRIGSLDPRVHDKPLLKREQSVHSTFCAHLPFRRLHSTSVLNRPSRGITLTFSCLSSVLSAHSFLSPSSGNGARSRTLR